MSAYNGAAGHGRRQRRPGHDSKRGTCVPKGDRGPDGGVDGVINFALIDPNVRGSVIKSRAIVQVKAGTVTTDAVGALYGIVQANPDFTAGILICFENQRATVDNWIRRHNPHPSETTPYEDSAPAGLLCNV